MSVSTLEELLRAGSRSLGDSSGSPRLDAELLLGKVTGLSRSALRSTPERTATAEQSSQYRALIERRCRGEPVAYLLGRQEFWSLDLEVGPDVLVPRPETECVVECSLAHLPANAPATVLDLGTGSGAIPLAIASERPQACIIATDISDAALAFARRNAQRLGLAVTFRQGSWFAPVIGERFNLIASNPPYIAPDDPDLDPDVAAYEPGLALISGPTGLEALEHLVNNAPDHLVAGGWLVLEHGWQQAGHLRNLLEQAGFAHVRSHADLAGHERVTEGQWPFFTRG